MRLNLIVEWSGDKVKDNAVVERLTGIKENAQVTCKYCKKIQRIWLRLNLTVEWSGDKVKDNSVVERLNGIKENAQVTCKFNQNNSKIMNEHDSNCWMNRV